MDSNFCATCGTAIVGGGKFCANCGAVVPVREPLTAADSIPRGSVPGPPPVSAANRDEPGNSTVAITRKPTKRSWLIGVPIALIAIVLLSWALLKGLPFNRDEKVQRLESRKVEVVQESSTQTAEPTIIGETATVVEIPSNASTEIAAPTPDSSTVTMTPQPAAPVIREIPDGVRTPPIAPPADPQSTVADSANRNAEISSSEAIRLLDSYLVGNNPYDVDLRCLSIRGVEYKNAGFTLSVRDRCDGGVLGQWRVDAKTREIYRQRSNGRFQRP